MEECCYDEDCYGQEREGEELQIPHQLLCFYRGWGMGAGGTYEDESPRNAIVLNIQVVDKEFQNTGHDDGGEELAEPEEVERKARVLGWLFGETGFRCGGNHVE